jgi:methyl-accepting chemotaxis protein
VSTPSPMAWSPTAASAASAAPGWSGEAMQPTRSGPGVALFRRLAFRGRAAVVSAAFLLVVLQFMALFVSEVLVARRAAEAELVGLGAQAHLSQAMQTAQSLRTSSLTPASVGLPTGELLRQLDKAASAGAELGLEEPIGFVRQALEPLSQLSKDADEDYAKADGAVQELLRAMQALGDRSGLNTDSDRVAYNLAAATLQSNWQLISAIGKVRDLGAHATRSGEASPAQQRMVLGETYALYKQVEALFTHYEKLVKAAPDLEAALGFNEAFDAVNGFMRHTRRALPAPGAGPGDPAALLKAGDLAVRALIALTDRTHTALQQRVTKRVQTEQQRMLMQLGLAGAGLLLAAYLFRCFYTVTRHSLTALSTQVERLAQGDFKTRVPVLGSDELSQVQSAMLDMQTTLCGLVGSVRGGVEQMVQHSERMTGTAQRLSRHTDDTAQRLQSSTQQLTTTAEEAREAVHGLQASSVQGQTACEHAEQSLRQMEHLQTCIAELNRSSDRVSDIVSVIDGIAFQTNILALNAAVEAARAGEHGRGFAVVAAEVRALAQRSATAAREIVKLIQDSRSSAQVGAMATTTAAQDIQQLARDVMQISQRLTELSDNQQHQVAKISEVAHAVSQIDRDCQANASLSEDAMQVASELRERAHELSGAAGRFQA